MKKKNKKKILLIVIPAAVIALLIAGAVVLYTCVLHKQTLVTRETSGSYELSVYMDGDPDFPYGAAHCRMVLKEGNKKICSTEVDVYNDGGAALAENFHCEWNETYVSVSVSSEEHETLEYDLSY